MNIEEIKEKLNNGVNPQIIVEDSINKARLYQDSVNAFVTILDNTKCENENGILANIPYSLKDNFSTKGIITTASSNILSDYIPPYDSTVYKKLKESGAVLIGKNTMDELAMGGTGLTAHTGITRNPWDLKRISGGSSSGSATAVSLGIVPFSIGSDTGDSIRKPASYTGCVGYKPTYGRISRFGLFPFASSLDHVGVLTRNVHDAALITDVLKGQDKYDMTTLPDENINYVDNLDNDITNKKLFYIKEIVDYNNAKTEETKEILDKFYEMVNKLRNQGISIEEVSFDKKLLECLFPTYFIISCAEATSNNSNLTGLIFGNKVNGNTSEEIMFNTRTNGFSEMIKRRFVIGSYILQKENQERLFINAKRVRNLVVTKMNELFKTYDALILPASGETAPLIESVDVKDKLSDEYLILENHLVIGNFGGYPSITLPFMQINKMPVGINITCMSKNDSLCLNIAKKVEDLTGLKDLKCEVK